MDLAYWMSLALMAFVEFIEFFDKLPTASTRETICIPASANPCINPLSSDEKRLIIQTCGRRPEQSSQNDSIVKIVNGRLADFREGPWAAQLIIPGGFSCTAVVLSKRHLLSSAHCFLDPKTEIMRENLDGIELRYGDVCMRQIVPLCPNPVPNKYIHSLRSVQYLKSFINDWNFDFALVELSNELKLDETHRPICFLPAENFDKPLARKRWIKEMCDNEYGADQLGYSGDKYDDKEHGAGRLRIMKIWISEPQPGINTDYMYTEAAQIAPGTEISSTVAGDSGGPLTCRLKQTGETNDDGIHILVGNHIGTLLKKDQFWRGHFGAAFTPFYRQELCERANCCFENL